MTGEAQAGIPPPLDNDDDDVAWALQTAAAQWKLAAFADAIVWLRRAVDSAIQAGHASRANELSGAAWRLTERMLAQADSPPPAPPMSDSGDIDDLLDLPAPPSGEIISVEFEATRTIPDPDTERSLTPSPPAGPSARRTSSTPARSDGSANLRFGQRTPPAPRAAATRGAATPRARGRVATPAIRPPPPRERRPPPPPPPPPPPREPAPLPSFPLDRPSDPFELGRGEPSDTVVPPEPDRDTEAPPDPFTPAPRSDPLPAFEPESTRTSVSTAIAAALSAGSDPPPDSEPTVSAETPFSRPPGSSARPGAPATPAAQSQQNQLSGVSLADVRGLQDLPEESQEALLAKARIERLSRNDELTGFGVALVLEGWISIMPAIAEVPCARATAGDVVCTWGTLDEAIVLSAVAGQDGTSVAVWEKAMLDDATEDCPWVADELRQIADRYQTLAGVTMGAMGDRLDESLRAMVTERCEVRALMPFEAMVQKGGPVPGLHIVGAGRIEIVDGHGDNAEVLDELGPGDFLFAAQVLQGGDAPAVARAGKSGALVLFAERKVAHELLVSVPPLLEIFAT